MTIKEFSRLCGCNPQTLRYYDHVDLLKPVKVDNAFMRWRRRTISAFNCCESGGTSEEAPVMGAEQQPPVTMKDSYR